MISSGRSWKTRFDTETSACKTWDSLLPQWYLWESTAPFSFMRLGCVFLRLSVPPSVPHLSGTVLVENLLKLWFQSRLGRYFVVTSVLSRHSEFAETHFWPMFPQPLTAEQRKNLSEMWKLIDGVLWVSSPDWFKGITKTELWSHVCLHIQGDGESWFTVCLWGFLTHWRNDPGSKEWGNADRASKYGNTTTRGASA